MLLDTKELRDLVDLLAPLAPQYHAVGVCLNVPMDEFVPIDFATVLSKESRHYIRVVDEKWRQSWFTC